MPPQTRGAFPRYQGSIGEIHGHILVLLHPRRHPAQALLGRRDEGKRSPQEEHQINSLVFLARTHEMEPLRQHRLHGHDRTALLLQDRTQSACRRAPRSTRETKPQCQPRITVPWRSLSIRYPRCLSPKSGIPGAIRPRRSRTPSMDRSVCSASRNCSNAVLTVSARLRLGHRAAFSSSSAGAAGIRTVSCRSISSPFTVMPAQR